MADGGRSNEYEATTARCPGSRCGPVQSPRLPSSSLLPVALSFAELAPQETVPVIGDGDLAFFEKSVRPVLVEHCYECHSVAKKRPKGSRRGG